MKSLFKNLTIILIVEHFVNSDQLPNQYCLLTMILSNVFGFSKTTTTFKLQPLLPCHCLLEHIAEWSLADADGKLFMIEVVIHATNVLIYCGILL